MSFGFVHPWHQFLPRQGGHIVGFMGSGGKTTLLRHVAQVYAQLGQSTVLTTTTRSEVLTGIAAYSWAELKACDTADLPSEIFLHEGVDEDGKWRGLSAEQVDELGGLLAERVVLVEVDGAAGQMLKLHREGEPVWPARTSLAIVVMGAGAVGAQVANVVHRWGKYDFARLSDVKDYSVFEWSHLAKLLLAERGYLAQLPAGVPAVLALTGIAEQDDSIGLFEFVGQAMDHPALPLVMFCSLNEGELGVRTACQDRDQDDGHPDAAT